MSKDIQSITRQPAVHEFLAQPYIARLATCNSSTGQPHVVPVWYEWDGETIWISSFRSTRKIKELRRNPRFSLVVDTDSRGDAARGVFFEGQAELVDDPAMGLERGFQIYARYLGEDGASMEEPQSWLHDPEHLLIHLRPDTVSAWDSSAQGFRALFASIVVLLLRQHRSIIARKLLQNRSLQENLSCSRNSPRSPSAPA